MKSGYAEPNCGRLTPHRQVLTVLQLVKPLLPA
jgi:hypothetical protein